MVPSVAEEKRDRELKLRVSEAEYKQHLENEKAAADKKAEEQRLEEERKAEEERRVEEEAFFTKFEAEQKRLQEQDPQKAEEADQYIEELMEQQEQLLTAAEEDEVSTDVLEVEAVQESHEEKDAAE